MAHSNTGDDLSLSERLRRMQTGGQKAAYLWYYYKWPVLGVMLGMALLGWFLHDWLRASNSHYILNVTLVNAAPAEDSTLFADFPLRFGYEADEEVYVDATVSIDLKNADARSAQAFQILAAEFAIGEIDLFVSEAELFSRMAENGGFLPLDTLFPEGLPAAWTEYLFYSGGAPAGGETAYGLLLTDTPLHAAGCYPPGTPLVFGVGGRSGHTEAAAEMLLYLGGQGVRIIHETEEPS